MPQATTVNGVGATLEGHQRQNSQVGEQMVQMAEAYTKVKQAEKERAMSQLQMMLQNVDKLPIDDKAIRKVAKKAGLPLADDETIAAVAHASKQPAIPGQAPAVPNKAQPAAAGQAPAQNPAAGGQKNPDAATAEAQKKMQENMTPEQAKTLVFEQFAAKARALSAAKFKDEQAKTEYNTHITQLKDAALSGSGQAAGQLMAAGEVPFNITQIAWNNASPEAKNKIYDIALGHETDAQRSERKTSIFNGLMQHGNMSAADAYSLADTLVSGGSLTPEQQKKMGTASVKQLRDQAEIIDTLHQIGVPDDKLQSTAQAAFASGSVVGALPTGLKSVATQELELKKKQLNIESGRNTILSRGQDLQDRRISAYEKSIDNKVEMDKSKRDLAWAKLQVLELSKGNDQFISSLKAVISAKKAGINIDPKELQKVTDQLQSLKITDNPQDFLNHAAGTGTSTAKPGADPVDIELN